ncbi:peptidase [Sphingobacterium phlebotomi]|uniref:Peptidase n=1 Tax=Sphingobacterium phlebotomi TaxID=2605433 RepID=A0A5D4H9P8_9SPHI|nr:M14 metallopeptidase family protein [Sphingobacterium phlebotomi]TYR37347.1 peptidase [Sphingobacterium phlebotomi]
MTLKHLKTILVALFVSHLQIGQSQQITSPKEHYGFHIGDDYMLTNYEQTESYFKKVAAQSDRVLIQEAGKTEEGRQQYLLVVSSPENLKNIEKYRAISQRLGRAENLTDEEAKTLSKEGKPIVWIDGGMHSSETVGTHQLIETFYQLSSSQDDEILNFLDKVIVLMFHVNPDGHDLLSNWYMQYEDKEKRNMSIPRLYQKYVGHDNNRDFFMFNMIESTNMAKLLYVDWLPQIMYNHHQTSPDGTIVAGPPYRDPFNHIFDPLLITGIDGVGFAMIDRLNIEGKPGYVRMDQSGFSTWWNGGGRTSPYFRNMIGILTETHGSPTPTEVPAVAQRLVPRNGLPNPIGPQKWHFKQSIDYSVSMNYAILDYAARNGDQLLYNFYKMGKNSIERGNKDNWTMYPKYAEQLEKAYDEAVASGTEEEAEPTQYYRSKVIPQKYYDAIYKNPENRDPRAYIISADQPDFATAVKFVNTLIKGGVYVHQSKAGFSYGGKDYPANTIVVKANQAFRPHIIDMFEPQDHPHDVQYPGGPPIRPYDAAGWTLAMQMGVEYDRIFEDIPVPLEKTEYGVLMTPPSISVEKGKAGYTISAKANDAFIAVNKLLKSGINVFRDENTQDFYVDAKAKPVLDGMATDYGLRITALAKKPASITPVNGLKIGLFDYYGGSMPSGWVRWLLEQYEYEYELFYPQDVDEHVIAKYDVLLFIGPGIPVGKDNGIPRRGKQIEKDLVPEKYHRWMGDLTKETSIPILKEYVNNGGKIVTVGTSSGWVYALGIGIDNPLMEENKDGKIEPVSNTKYFIPTSILAAEIDTDKAENYGMKKDAKIVFNNSPVFQFQATDKLYSLGKFTTDKPLLSGWAHGQEYLKDTHLGLVALLGKGKIVAIGPEVTNRGQSHGTFKMLFNQLYQ